MVSEKMTHYGVLVALPKDTVDVSEAIEWALLPFDEGAEQIPYVSETVVEIIADKQRRIDQIKFSLADEKYGNTDKLWKEATKEKLNELEKMSDEDWYKSEVEGCQLNEHGDKTSTYNPQSKWDWYVVGGRWKDGIPLKSGIGADITKVRHMRTTPSSKDITNIKKQYKKYKRMSKEKDRTKIDSDFVFSDFDPKQSEADFVRQTTAVAFYAFVDKDGEWHERAECGWFGTEHNATEDKHTWATKFVERYIAPLDKDDILVIVDCHI